MDVESAAKASRLAAELHRLMLAIESHYVEIRQLMDQAQDLLKALAGAKEVKQAKRETAREFSDEYRQAGA